MRCDRFFDNFCMILAKLMVEKKLRQENSVSNSTSSSCLLPLGRMLVRMLVCRGGRSISSTGQIGWGSFAKFNWQYRKKLWCDIRNYIIVIEDGELVLRGVCFRHYSCGYLLQTEHLQNQQQAICVQKVLAQVVEFHYICFNTSRCIKTQNPVQITTHERPWTTSKLTTRLQKPLSK